MVLAIIAIIISVTATYAYYQMDLCQTSSLLYDNVPEMSNVLDCLRFLSGPDPFFPHGEPTIDYDLQFVELVLLEMVLIVGSASGVLVFASRGRKRK